MLDSGSCYKTITSLNCSQKGKSCPGRTLENLKKKIDPPKGGKERKKEKSKKG